MQLLFVISTPLPRALYKRRAQPCQPRNYQIVRRIGVTISRAKLGTLSCADKSRSLPNPKFPSFWMTSWKWLNPPSGLTISQGRVSFTTSPKTDYWHPPDRVAANGHFYYTKAALPFDYGIHVQCTVQGDWNTKYDQAGIMVRKSAEQWIKAGVEFVNGKPYLRSPSSIVLTIQLSCF